MSNIEIEITPEGAESAAAPQAPAESAGAATPPPVAEAAAEAPARKLEVPEWAREIKRKYLSQNVSQFIVHGNIQDYIKVVENGATHFVKARDFLTDELFKTREMVAFYDRAAGIRFKDDTRFGGDSRMRREFEATLQMLAELSGNPPTRHDPEPGLAFYALDKYLDNTLNQNLVKYIIQHLERRLNLSSGKSKEKPRGEDMDIIERFMRRTLPEVMDEPSSGIDDKKMRRWLESLRSLLKKPRSIAMIIDFAEQIIPMTESSRYRPSEQMALVFLQKWAKEDIFLKADMTVIVMTENIADLNQQYIRNPYTYEVMIPYPDEQLRLDFINWFYEKHPGSQKYFEMTPEVLAKNTAGLALINLNIIMSEAARNQIPFTNDELTRRKKEMIEAEAGGLLEFVETKYSLEDVAGHKYAKKHLLDAARSLKAGRSDVLPMGYLVSGPVGTGKTFMISCFATDIGVPMVELKNFRSQWQGVTEGNLQKVLKLLKAMSPVAVMIDEADAYLGNRHAQGDSGVSSRVFSMIASFMSDTDNRGKIVWFLVTARPDLMPVDFKRQGRAEEHIGLFYPETLEEKRELLQVMLRKTGLKYVDLNEFDDEFLEDMTIRSGADMEAALTRAKFKAAALGLDKVNFDVIAKSFSDFLPPTYPEEIELMNYAAVLECTSKELLPERYRNMSREEVLEKVEELKNRIP